MSRYKMSNVSRTSLEKLVDFMLVRRKCKWCGEYISEREVFCPKCGRSQT